MCREECEEGVGEIRGVCVCARARRKELQKENYERDVREGVYEY